MSIDLKAFVTDIDEGVRCFEDEYSSRDEAFTAYVVNEIAELINLDDYTITHGIIKDSADRTSGEIYGYSLSKSEEVLTLFYSIYNPTANMEVKTLVDTEFQTAINRMQGFYNKALRGYCLDLEDDGKTNAPEYEPAKLIFDKHPKITAVRLLVLSNSIIRNYDIKNRRINGKVLTPDVWDLKKIQGNLSSGQDHVPIDVDFTSDEYNRFKIPFIKMDTSESDYNCVVALFPGKLLYKLYECHNTDLLMSNVRFFLGFKGSKKSNANIGILNTVKQEPQKFLAFNNGITALATGIESQVDNEGSYDLTGQADDGETPVTEYIRTGILKTIRDFRIVNGGQTTAALFHAKHNNKDVALQKVYVQVKIIILPEDSESTNKMADDITRYSNSQSKIKPSDFSASNPFNTTLEKLSRNTIIPNEKNELIYWYFERVRGQYDQEKKNIKTKEEQRFFEAKYPKDKKFKKEEYAKVWRSWEQKPYDAVKGESTNYDLYMSEKSDSIPDEVYFKNTVALLIIYKFLMSRPENKQYGNRRATIAMYCIAYLRYKTFGHLNLDSIWEKQDLSDNLKRYLMQLCEAMNAALQDLAGEIAVISWGKRNKSYEAICKYPLNCDHSLLKEEEK